jgi:hypothetical protein
MKRWQELRLPRPDLRAIFVDERGGIVVGGLGFLAWYRDGRWEARGFLGARSIGAIDAAGGTAFAVGYERVMVARGARGFTSRERSVVASKPFHFQDVRVLPAGGPIVLLGRGSLPDPGGRRAWFEGGLISTDGGRSFDREPFTGGAQNQSLSRGPGPLYAAQHGTVFRWQGARFSPCAGWVPPGYAPTRMWSSGEIVVAANERGLHRSSDGGATFVAIEAGVDLGGTADDGRSVALAGDGAGRLILAGPRGRVARSADAGATWQLAEELATGDPLSCVAFGPNEELWAVTATGLLLTTGERPAAVPRDLVPPLDGYSW